MKFLPLLILLCLSFRSFAQEPDHSFYPFKDHRGWGVKRVNGTELFHERYDSIFISNTSRYKNRIRVCRNKNWGIVDSTGKVTIPLKYAYLGLDQFGFTARKSLSKTTPTFGFLSLNGDTLIPFEHTVVLSQTVKRGDLLDFILLANKERGKDKYAIYSSDGVRRTEYEYNEVHSIDSTKLMSTKGKDSQNYFGVHSLVTDKYGIYDAINKKTVVPPIYEGVCTSWCYLTKNPHFHPGPVVYTGKTPIFHMTLPDDLRLIDIHGNIIFSSKKVGNWDKNKRYYVGEDGTVTIVKGGCTERDQELEAPYVMNDSRGYFLVDESGAEIFGNKRSHLIRKFNHSKNKAQRFNYYIIQETPNGPKRLLDYALTEKIPPAYTDIIFDSKTRSFIATKDDSSSDFYDSLYVQQSADPRIWTPKHNFFFTENHLTGIKSKDSNIVHPATYLISELVPKYKTQSDSTFYILSDYSTSVDVYNNKVEEIMHFDADYYRYLPVSTTGGRSLLLLVNKEKLSIFDFEDNSWLMKDKPSISSDSIKWSINLQRNHYIPPRIELYAEKLYLWVYSLEQGWTLYNDKGQEELRWKRRIDGYPKILHINETEIYAIQRTKKEGIHETFVANSKGDELHAKGRLFHSIFVPKLNKVFIKYFDHKVFHVYDDHFNKIGQTNGRIFSFKGGDCYVHFNKEEKICEIVTKNSTEKITDARFVGHMGSDLIKISTGNATYLRSRFSTKTTRKYAAPPQELTPGVQMSKVSGDWPNQIFDFYKKSGELLFTEYRLIKKIHKYGKGGYFIVRNDQEEVWVTNAGEIFHRNDL